MQDREIWGFVEKREEKEEEGRGVSVGSREGKGGTSARSGEGMGRCGGGEDRGGGGRRGEVEDDVGRWRGQVGEKDGEVEDAARGGGF